MKKAASRAKPKAEPMNIQKWGRELIDPGYTVIPNIIIERQRALGLDALDMNIVLYLAMRWHKVDSPPFPNKATLAVAMNVSRRTIQRRIASLRAAGFLRTEERMKAGRQTSNAFYLDGLIAQAKKLAVETSTRKAREVEERERRGRPRRLRLIKGG